ncbi:rpl22 [Symbiodinium microadriaticum]|nr:rpl22 [Symbiodinium microadriaticum]
MVATGLPPGRSQRFRDAAYLEGPRALQLRRKKGSAPAKKAAELSELALGLVPLAEVRSKALPTKTFKFTVDCQQPAEDTIIEPKDDFEKFLTNKIKVDGKTGNLGEKVSIRREKAKVHVTAEGGAMPLHRKYLGKKYLKAQQLRDFLRIVAPSRTSYEMRYFNINDEKNEETLKFTVDCQQPAEDTIIEPKDFEKFLANKIKVDGKTGNLGEKVSIHREKAKVHVTAESQQLRDFLRIVAPSKTSYEMRYFNINDDKGEEERHRALSTTCDRPSTVRHGDMCFERQLGLPAGQDEHPMHACCQQSSGFSRQRGQAKLSFGGVVPLVEALQLGQQVGDVDLIHVRHAGKQMLGRLRSSFQLFFMDQEPQVYDTDADHDLDDDDPVAEEEMAEKEEVLNDTLGKAKQEEPTLANEIGVVDVLKQLGQNMFSALSGGSSSGRVDTEMDAAKAQLVEIGAKASAAAQLVGQRGEVNDKLRAISEEAQQLEDQMAYTTVGSPFRYRVRLIKLAGEAERAGQLMEARIQKLKEALRMLKNAGGEFVDDNLEREGEGEEGEQLDESTPLLAEVQSDAVEVGVHEHERIIPTRAMAGKSRATGQSNMHNLAKPRDLSHKRKKQRMFGQPGQMPLMLGMDPQMQMGHQMDPQMGPQMGAPGKLACRWLDMSMDIGMGCALSISACRRMEEAEEAAMSGVTASKEDEEATAKEMEDTMEDTTWSIDVLPIPQPSDVEPQEPAPDGVPPLPVAETSSDPTAKCALQGQPFTWCRVGSEEEPTCAKLDVAEDPTGRDHALGVKGRQRGAVGLLSFGSNGVMLEVRMEVMKHSSHRFVVPEVFLQHRLKKRKATKVERFPEGLLQKPSIRLLTSHSSFEYECAGHDQPGHTLPGSFYDQFGGLGGGQGQFGGAGYDQVGYDTQGVTGYDPYTGMGLGLGTHMVFYGSC